MKKMLLCLAVLLVTVSGAGAHTGNDEVTPIGNFGPLQVTRKMQKNNDTGYTLTYNNAKIRLPKMRLYELVDALQDIQSHALLNASLPLVLHGGLRLQRVTAPGPAGIQITDRKNRSTILTPEQQQELTAALQQEVQPPAMVSLR